MNDHDPVDALLADLHTEVPEMSDSAFEAGRSRLQARVSSEPVTIAPEPDVAVVPLPKRRLLRSPPLKLVAAAAAVVAVAAGALVVQTTKHDGPGESAAAAQLNIVADRINPVDEPIGPDQYRYSVTHRWNLYLGSIDKSGNVPRLDDDIKVMVETKAEKWVPADPTQQCTFRYTTTGKRKWVEGNAEQAQEAGIDLPAPKSHDVVRPCADEGDVWWGAPSQELLASLPRDPIQLNDRLRNDARRTQGSFGADLTLVDSVTSLLASGMVPADLRAALYRTLALTPGMEITEQAANLDGVKGTAFGVTGEGRRHEVIIDPTTGQFIGSRHVQVAGYEESPGTGIPPSGPPSEIRMPPLKEELVVGYSSTSNPVVVDRVGETS